MKEKDKRTANPGRPKKDRYHAHFQIDNDLRDKMRVQDNQSNLVNRLLREYFKIGSHENRFSTAQAAQR